MSGQARLYGVDTEWHALAGFPHGAARRFDVGGEMVGAAVAEVHGEEICSPGDTVSAIVGHGGSAAWTMRMGQMHRGGLTGERRHVGRRVVRKYYSAEEADFIVQAISSCCEKIADFMRLRLAMICSCVSAIAIIMAMFFGVGGCRIFFLTETEINFISINATLSTEMNSYMQMRRIDPARPVLRIEFSSKMDIVEENRKGYGDISLRIGDCETKEDIGHLPISIRERPLWSWGVNSTDIPTRNSDGLFIYSAYAFVTRPAPPITSEPTPPSGWRRLSADLDLQHNPRTICGRLTGWDYLGGRLTSNFIFIPKELIQAAFATSKTRDNAAHRGRNAD